MRNSRLGRWGMWSAFLLVLTPAVDAWADRIVIGSKSGGGQIWVREGSDLSDVSTLDGFGGGVTALAVQSDNSILVGTDTGGLTRRDPFTLNSTGGGGGFGGPINTLAVFPDDRVFIGFKATPGLSNTQVRNPILNAIVSGPGQFGDGDIIDSLVLNNGDLFFAYSFSTLPEVSRGRIRICLGGDLATSGGDEGLGAVGGNSIYPVALTLQKNTGNVVLAKTDRYVELRSGVSPTGQAAGAFAADITALATLSDGRVVIGTAGGEIQVRTADLGGSLASNGGYGEVSALAVLGNDNIVVGNKAGQVWLLDPSLATIQTSGGYGEISSLAVLSIVLSQWNVDADGNWSTATNWSGGEPNAVGAIANFGTIITSARTVTVDAPKTVGSINFSSPISYTIAGSNPITLNVNSGPAGIGVTAGSHLISAPLVLADDLRVTAVTTSGVAITGELSATGKNIFKAGEGTAQFENLRAANLNVNEGTAIISAKTTANSAAGTSRLDSLTMNTVSFARLDLNNNSLVVNSGSLATVTASIKSALENGGNFDWLGPGIGSTQANVQNTSAGSFLYGLGVILNDLAQVGGSGPIYTDFAGQTLSGNEILVKFTYFGDADLSGSIDATDYSLIDNGYVNTLTGWINGDFDYSGSIDATDYALIDNAYVNQAGPLAEALIAEHARMFGGEYLAALRAIQSGVIPEPGALGLFIAALPAAGERARPRRGE